MEGHLHRFRDHANSYLSRFEPLLLLVSPLIVLSVAWIIHLVFSCIQDQGLKTALTNFAVSSIKLIPGVAGHIQAEKEKVVAKLQSNDRSKRASWRKELPHVGFGEEVLELLEKEKSKDADWQGRCSGTVYIGGSQSEGHFSLTNRAYSMFSHTNPLHIDVFRSVVQFEGEVVAMTASLLGSKDKASGGQVCGNMTSGGTESILLAVKSSRDYMRNKKGITKPEMIVPESAHSAYDKAAQYFCIKLLRVPVNKDFQADVRKIRQVINKNTILIVGSAPGFPHGVIDPIETSCCRSLEN